MKTKSNNCPDIIVLNPKEHKKNYQEITMCEILDVYGDCLTNEETTKLFRLSMEAHPKTLELNKIIEDWVEKTILNEINTINENTI